MTTESEPESEPVSKSESKSKPDKRVLAAIAVFHTAAVVLTWRDLRARPDGQVRGDRRIWRIASALNTLGSAAYWLFGRRRGTGGRTTMQ